MTLSMIFWLLVLLKLILNGFVFLGPQSVNGRLTFGANLLDFLLLIVIGLKLFGSPLQGG